MAQPGPVEKGPGSFHFAIRFAEAEMSELGGLFEGPENRNWTNIGMCKTCLRDLNVS